MFHVEIILDCGLVGEDSLCYREMITFSTLSANIAMNDNNRTREELIRELAVLRRENAALRIMKAEHERMKSESPQHLGEEFLRESDQRISDALEFSQSILNTSSIGILTYDAAGQCVFANKAAAEIAGTNVAGLLAQNFHHIEAWKRAGMFEVALRALDTGTEQQIETHVVTTFGKDVC